MFWLLINFLPLVSPFPLLFKEMGHGKKLGLSKARQIQVHVLSRPPEALGLFPPEPGSYSSQQHSLNPTRAPAPFARIWELCPHLTPLRLLGLRWDVHPHSKPEDHTLALTHVLGSENQAMSNTFLLPRLLSDEHFILKLVLLKSFKLCVKLLCLTVVGAFVILTS